ncbi:MAG: alkaline phosphatase [Bacteroidaceae bacterium]|nr:alkaline phosphatase [Bacteroides sp.]MBQ8242848.1 alkaline phosphatase [Bacteroidaceae bacterium]MBQ8601220.1 alkaline phosphatase [Bacteroides sp.]
MKRFFLLMALVVWVALASAQRAKYVFYFIGDGMGFNQINSTEMYLASQKGYIGAEPLLLSSFPVTGFATTFSATHPVTDSAAGGTALAVGEKTYNDAIGMDTLKHPLYSIAVKAKEAGKKVGITTTVSIDHATPAAFYAHQIHRNMYYEIALDLPVAGFDFYGGGGFVNPNTTYDKKKAPSIYSIFDEAGYTVARGLQEYKEKSSGAHKMILMQRNEVVSADLPFAIDRTADDLTLAQITESAVSFLAKDNKGFFLMIEGGRVDKACHGNDARTMFGEVMDMDEAVKVAYEFYKRHPKETLIVVTADHETAGLGIGAGPYTLNLAALSYQKQSVNELSRAITTLRKDGKATWEQVKNLLSEKMGFWSELVLTWEQEKILRDEFETSFVKRKVKFEETLYAKTEPLAAAARKVINQIAGLAWCSTGHSAAYVPVFAVGVGADLFAGKMDNTEIPRRIAKAAGYK